jgi:hypothetical protein
LGRV